MTMPMDQIVSIVVTVAAIVAGNLSFKREIDKFGRSLTALNERISARSPGTTPLEVAFVGWEARVDARFHSIEAKLDQILLIGRKPSNLS